MNNKFIVHMNGTSKGELCEQHRNVLVKAQELEDRLRTAAPNMRDYYPAENGAELFEAAREAYADMLRKVQEVQTWAMQGAVHSQGGTVE